MPRSEKRLRMRRERFAKKESRRREQFERNCSKSVETMSETSGIQESFRRLESRRRSERRLLRQAIIKIIVSIVVLIGLCYAVGKFIAVNI